MSQSIGKSRAFPNVVSEDTQEIVTGMTYRQWLIGMALGGLSGTTLDAHDASKCAIEHADMVIDRLDEEANK